MCLWSVESLRKLSKFSLHAGEGGGKGESWEELGESWDELGKEYRDSYFCVKSYI